LNQEIPENWIKVKFKELAKEKSVRVDDPKESGHERYVGLEHLDSGELVVKRYGSTSDVTSTMKLFEKDDVLFARRNTYLRRVSVAPFDGVCSGDIIVLEPILKYLVKGFLPIFMQFEPFENKIIALSAGAFSKRIKWKQLAEEEIVIPSIEEQKKIVETIWNIQNNIDKNDNLIKITEKIKNTLLNKLIINGFDNTTYKVTDIGNIPTEWSLVKLGDFSNIMYGYTASATQKAIGPKLLRITDIQDGVVDWANVPYCHCTPDKFEKYRLEDGDIVFARTGATTGKSYLVKSPHEAVFASYLIKVRVNEEFIPEFVYNFFQSSIYWNQINSDISGSAQGGVNATKLSNLQIVMPPLNEQEKIVDILETFNSSTRQYLDNKTNLSSMHKKLINEFLSGNLKIPQEALQHVQ